MSLADNEVDRARDVARLIKQHFDTTGLDEETMRLILRLLLQFRATADLTGFRDQLISFKSFLDTNNISTDDMRKALILMQRVRF